MLDGILHIETLWLALEDDAWVSAVVRENRHMTEMEYVEWSIAKVQSERILAAAHLMPGVAEA